MRGVVAEKIFPRLNGVRDVKDLAEVLKAVALLLKYSAEFIRAVAELVRSIKN